MDYTEIVDLECSISSKTKFVIDEEHVKTKQINRIFKVSGSFTYRFPEYKDRFLIWIVNENSLVFKEYSTNYELLGDSIEVQFEKGKVLNVNVFETESHIEFLITGSLTSVRFSLYHPSKLRIPPNNSHRHSIFYGVTSLNETRQLVTPYFDASLISSVNAYLDIEENMAYFSYGLSSGSIYVISVPEDIISGSVVTYEMKERDTLSKFISGMIPSFRNRNDEYSDISILDMTYILVESIILLISVSKDNKLKIWNIKEKQFLFSEDMLLLALETNDIDRSPATINLNSLISSHKIKSLFHDTEISDYDDIVVVNFHCRLGEVTLKNWIVFRVILPEDQKASANNCSLQICKNINDNGRESVKSQIIDYTLAYDPNIRNAIGVWVLRSEMWPDGNYCYTLNWRSLTEEYSEYSVTCRLYEPCRFLDLFIHPEQDIQEASLDCIFTPGNASIKAILNTINKEKDMESSDTLAYSINYLKKELAMLIESRVEKEIEPYIENNEQVDVLDVSRKSWLNLLHEIMAEHVMLMEPQKIILVNGNIGLIRLHVPTLMRQATGMEEALLSKSMSNKALQTYYKDLAGSGLSLLTYLFTCSNSYQISETWNTVKYMLFVLGASPNDLVQSLKDICPVIPSVVQTRLENAPETIDRTVDFLEKFELLDYFLDDDKEGHNHNLSLFGISLLHYNIRLCIYDRIMMSMSLLALLKPRMINSPMSGHLSDLVHRLVVLIKSLVSIHWLLSLRQSASSSLTDQQKLVFASLNLLEDRILNPNCSDIVSIQVLKSLQMNIKLAVSDNTNWQMKIKEEMWAILSNLNPVSESFALIQIAKYFFTYNLPLELIDYLKFLTRSEPKRWWNGDYNLVEFLLAISYILLNKPSKAVECFLKCVSTSEITSSLLPVLLFSEEYRQEIDSQSVLQISLLLKFIDILENMEIEEPCILKLADVAMEICDKFDDSGEILKNKSILCMIQYKNYIYMNKYLEAKTAILKNPDSDKQRDCLRQFIVTLCESNELNTLVKLDYGNLKEEFLKLVKSKATSSDLSEKKNRYYDLLFSYLMKMGDLKSAAICMLELALRLDVDSCNYLSEATRIDMMFLINNLKRQVEALLSCVSICTLLPKEDCLFVVPATCSNSLFCNYDKYPSEDHSRTAENMDVDLESGSNCDNSILNMSAKLNDDKERCVVTLNDIRRHFSLLRSELRIINENESQSFIRTMKLTPRATLNILLELSLYKDAFTLVVDHELGLNQIIDALTSNCVKIYKNCFEKSVLKEKENIIEALEELNDKADFSSIGCIKKLIWILLEEMLKKYDKSPNGDGYLRVCNKLLTDGMEQIPSWLVNVIVEEKKAAGALILQYLNNSALKAASNLTLKVLDDKIDEVTLRYEELRYGNQTSRLPQLNWLSLPVIFALLDVLEQMSSTVTRAKELHTAISEKLRLIGSFQKISSYSSLAIEMGC